jgi:uncharacterized membrane protein
MTSSKKTVISSAVASLIALSACGPGARQEQTGTKLQAQEVKCSGINECKGTSECASADGKSACQGQNECKGMGWVTVPSADECVSKGGKVLS